MLRARKNGVVSNESKLSAARPQSFRGRGRRNGQFAAQARLRIEEIMNPASAISSPPVNDAGEIRLGKIRVDELIVKSGALQQAILNSSNFSVIATDEKGIVQLFNAGAEIMLGYAAAEVVDRLTPADISDPEELGAQAAALSREHAEPITPGFEALVFKAARGIEDIYELTFIRKDGSRFPAIVSVTALRTDQVPIIGYLLIATDNTARKGAEDNRLRVKASFELMVESVTDYAIVMLDEEGLVKTWNKGAKRIQGYAAEEIMGQSISCFFIPEDIASGEPERALREAATTGKYEYEGWRVRKGGSTFWANVIVNAIYDSQGALIGYTKLTRDMTEQKNAVDALKESEARVRSILDTVPDAIVTIDEAGLIEFFSPAATRLFGYTEAEAIGQNVKVLIPQSARDGDDGYLSHFRETGEKRIGGSGRTVVGQRQDGSTFAMELAVAEALGGRRQLFTGFARDITERQRVEFELKEAKALAEAASLAKSEFLSSMSHELRTPLNAILGFGQLLQSDMPPPTSVQTASIDQILRAGWFLLELINEILDLALVESGKSALSLEAVSLTDMLSECRAMMQPLAQKRGITMQFPASGESYVISADRTRLRQVLVNLLSNAIKYNGPNGSVTVECDSPPSGGVRVSVGDTGPGLTPEKLAQLFQPFNRLGQEGGTEEGTGIGLVVTKRLVEAMGGTIGVESTVNQGTVFWISLCSLDPSEAGLIKSETESSRQIQIESAPPRRTVLYVEDNPANLMLVEMLIARRPDLLLLTASNASLGVELARAHLPDAILMDVNLPGISGVKALAMLREDDTTAHIPIIAVSANAGARDIEKGLNAGFLRYLTKPINVDELMRTLDMALALSADGPSLTSQAA
jgi:PAS domain S-box-containing protein